MFLNENEGVIIGSFLKNLNIFDKEEMTLVWGSGERITARFDTCFEDSNEFEEDEKEYEEFTTFVFESVCIAGTPPVFITEDNFFCVNRDVPVFTHKMYCIGIMCNFGHSSMCYLLCKFYLRLKIYI